MEITESRRSVRACMKVSRFHSGVASDELDGSARYRAKKLAISNVGGTASNSRPCGDGRFFYSAVIG